MRAKRISDGLNGLPPGEDVTAKQIVHWIIDALEVTSNIPDFTINSAGRVSTSLFRHLHAETAKKVFPFHMKTFAKDFSRVVTAVDRVLHKTVENGGSFRCWTQVGQFLNDLQQYCKNGLFMAITAAIGASLLTEMTKVPGFDENEDIIDSMLLLYKCGVALPKIWENRRKVSKSLFLVYTNCRVTFLKLIGKELIFSSDAFFPITKEILFDSKEITFSPMALSEYLDAVHFPLLSNDQAAKANMVTFLRRPDTTELLIALLGRKETHFRGMILKILRATLIYSRNTSTAYDIDWTTVFVRTLYWHSDAVDLLLFETQATEPNEDLKSRNLMERVVQIYLQYNDLIDKMPAQEVEKDMVRGFIHLLQNNINFQDCNQLFFLLRKYVVENPARCAVLILFIENVAKILDEQPTSGQYYRNLIKKTFEHIQCVKPYPELLSRLLNIFNKSKMNNDQALCKEIQSIVPDAFLRSDQYRTAVDLLEILKVVGFDNDKLVSLFENLLAQLESDELRVRRKETLVLVLATSDVYDVFKVLHPDDRRTVFDYFKSGLHGNGDDDEKALCASLMAHMLAAIHSTTDKFPKEADNATEVEGALLHQFLLNAILAAEERTFAAVHLGIATCVYNTTFTPISDGLHASLIFLTKSSVHFRLNYELDAKQNAAINDLRLLEKYWRCAIAVFKQTIPQDLIPSFILETHFHTEIHFAGQAREFLDTILHYDAIQRYSLFAWSVFFLVNDTSNCRTTVKKLMKFVESNVSTTDATAIAQNIFLALLELLVNEKRLKTVYAIQTNLYRNHIKENADAVRRNIMDIVDAHINTQRGDLQKRLQDLRNLLQPTANNVPDEQMSDDEQPNEGVEDDELLEILPGNNRSTLGGARQSLVLTRFGASVNTI